MADEWEGGRHQGIPWRRAGAAVLVVAVVAGGVYAVRRERRLSIETGDTPITAVSEAEVEVVATAPLQAGDLWYCPSSHPVRVHEDGRYYPQEYPRSGSHIARPANCYEDAERAEEAGYELAPPPPGAVIAGGVYLVPAQGPTTLECAELAGRAGFAVPCPGMLPAPGESSSCEDDRCLFRGGVIIEQRSFQTPARWSAEEHVVLTAVPLAPGSRARRGRRLRVDGDDALVKCSPDDHVRAQGQGWFLRCSSSSPWIPRLGGYPHESHIAMFWLRGRVVYGASVEGWDDESWDILAAVVDGIRYVDPAPAR